MRKIISSRPSSSTTGSSSPYGKSNTGEPGGKNILGGRGGTVIGFDLRLKTKIHRKESRLKKERYKKRQYYIQFFYKIIFQVWNTQIKTTEPRREMFYLMMHSTHFVNKMCWKFVLFNDATGTHWFLSYHRLLDVIHMVTLTHFLEGNPLAPHRLLFSISSKGSFICTFP